MTESNFSLEKDSTELFNECRNILMQYNGNDAFIGYYRPFKKWRTQLYLIRLEWIIGSHDFEEEEDEKRFKSLQISVGNLVSLIKQCSPNVQFNLEIITWGTVGTFIYDLLRYWLPSRKIPISEIKI